jgi:peptidoglycan/xylan/chitin deacetylase (PgdA/CDA1 family)
VAVVKAIALMYHDVVEADDAGASGFPGLDAALYKLPGELFDRHLEALARHARAVSVRELLAGPPSWSGRSGPSGPRGSPPPAARRFLLTFDDGGASALRTADRLDALGWRGHFLVPTDYVGSAHFSSKSELRQIAARGHLVGSHSASHPLRMSALPPAQLRIEWRTSLAVLSEILGAPVTIASVPGGHYARAVGETAAEAGVEALFTSEPTVRVQRIGGCAILGRYSLARWMSPETAAALVTGTGIARVRQALTWNAKKAVKAATGPLYLPLRRGLIRFFRGGGR